MIPRPKGTISDILISPSDTRRLSDHKEADDEFVIITYGQNFCVACPTSLAWSTKNSMDSWNDRQEEARRASMILGRLPTPRGILRLGGGLF